MPSSQKRNAVKAIVVGAVGAAVLSRPAERAYIDPATSVNANVLGGWLRDPPDSLASNALNSPDYIGRAGKALADKAYPFMQEVDWNSMLYLGKPGGTASALDWLKAVDSALVMGQAMDSQLLKKAAFAHHEAIKTIDTKGLLSKASFADVNEGIGKLIASVPTAKTMAVYNSFKDLVGADVPPYLMSTVKEADAKAAYQGLMEFKDVVKKNPIAAVEPGAPAYLSSGQLAAIDKAAAKLSTASYPFIKDIDWTSDLYLKPLPAVDGKAALKAVDSMIVMGANMDPKLLKDAVGAHHKAIAGVDAKGVLSQADYTAVNAGIGKIIASVPTSEVMNVYNSFAKIVNPAVGNNLFVMNSKGAAGADAIAAYTALMEFKDVVKAAQL